MGAFHIWKEDPPPGHTVVMAKYALTDPGNPLSGSYRAKWQLVMTCRRGCCVRMYPDDGFGTMVLPKYWREPTAEELSAAASSREEQR